MCKLPLDLPSSVYASPEWRTAQQGEIQAADVFALGMVLLHMAQLWFPLDFYSCDVSLPTSVDSCLARISNYSQGFKDLLGSMLAVHPRDRLSMRTVLKRASRHCIFKVPNAFPPQNSSSTVPLAVPRGSTCHLEGRASAQEVIPAYAEEFKLCCSRGDYENAEEIVEATCAKQLDPFPLYQTFISIAMAHGLNRLAKTLTCNAISVLSASPSALSSQYAYCYQQLTTISTRMGCVQDTERYVHQWLALSDSSERPELLEMLVTGANAALLADRKTQCMRMGTRALDLLGRQAEPGLLLQLLTLVINAAFHTTKMSEKRQDNYLRLLGLVETTPGIDLYVRELKIRGADPYFDFALDYVRPSEQAWISLKGVAALRTELGGDPQQVASILRSFVRSFEEVEGEQGQRTLTSLQIAENLAESWNLPLLATELQLTREQYSGKVVNPQDLAENWVTQGELIRAEEVCFAAKTTNVFQSSFDELQKGLIITKISPKETANFLNLASSKAISAISFIPECRIEASEVHLSLSLFGGSAEWRMKSTYRANDKFRSRLAAIIHQNPLQPTQKIVETFANQFETYQQSEFSHYLSNLKATYTYLAQVLALQSQFYVSTGNFSGAQNAGQRAAMASDCMAQLSSLRPALMVIKTLLVVSQWPEARENLQEVDAGEEMWRKLVIPLLGKAEDPVPSEVAWSFTQASELS